MSVEQFVIVRLVQDGSPKRAFAAGISQDDFVIYDEEWEWIVTRAEQHKPISPRIFKRDFPEFEFVHSGEKVGDLLDELKQERAYLAVSSAIDEIVNGDEPLEQENAIEKAQQLREILGGVLKIHAPQSDVSIKSGWERHYQRVKELSILAETEEIPGIPTGYPHMDVHWGGLQGENSYVYLGRPGDAKSFSIAKLAVEGALAGYRMGLFSPEMTEHQHNARIHTLLSARTEIQEALGLSGAFRNRALKDGKGFNLKHYRRFLQWLDENLKGEIHLFTRKYHRQKMTTGYIRTRIEEYGLDAMLVDPIYKLQSPRRRMSRWEELQEITDSLVDLAHEFNIPVVMSNQANRALIGRRGEAPGKDSSYGSDAPVQEADTVIGVKHYAEDRIMSYVCSKNRHGEPFSFKARFYPNLGVMEDVTPIKSDRYYNGYDPDKVEELAETLQTAFDEEEANDAD